MKRPGISTTGELGDFSRVTNIGGVRHARSIGDRTADDEEDLPAAVPLLLRPLFHLLPRPREYRVRGVDYEQGFGPQRLYLRAWRGGLFLGLLPARSAEQSDHGKGRGAPLDRPHHDQLGHRVRRLRLHSRADQFLLPAVWLRARIVAGFMAAIPVSLGLGAPVSTAFLQMDGILGLAGWKWLFLGEAAPAVVFGLLCVFYLPDRPDEAAWLSEEEKRWLEDEMQKEKKAVTAHRTFSVLQTMYNPRVLALAAIHFGQAAVSVGLAVFSAQIVKSMGLSIMQTGFTTSIPYIFGTVGMILWGNYSDRKNERRWNLTGSCTVMAIGCVIAGVFAGTWLSIIGLSLMTVGLYAGNAHLFPLPSVFLAGPALASGIAWVNSVGILGGSVSPPVMGWLKDYTGSYAGGLYALAGFAAMAAIVSAICVRETPAAPRLPAEAAAAAGD